MIYLVSACLLGQNCKYNGKNNYNKAFWKLVKTKKIVPFCPEQAGGLTTPRLPAEIQGKDGFDVLKGNSKVVTCDGVDVTKNYVKGAKETLKIIKLFGVQRAILKSKSPSCGCKYIYNGDFSGKLKKGVGVTAAYLKIRGIETLDSNEFLEKSSTCLESFD